MALHPISWVTIRCIDVFSMFSASSWRHPYLFRYRLYNQLSENRSIEKFMFRYLGSRVARSHFHASWCPKGHGNSSETPIGYFDGALQTLFCVLFIRLSSRFHRLCVLAWSGYLGRYQRVKSARSSWQQEACGDFSSETSIATNR